MSSQEPIDLRALSQLSQEAEQAAAAPAALMATEQPQPTSEEIERQREMRILRQTLQDAGVPEIKSILRGYRRLLDQLREKRSIALGMLPQVNGFPGSSHYVKVIQEYDQLKTFELMTRAELDKRKKEARKKG